MPCTVSTSSHLVLTIVLQKACYHPCVQLKEVILRAPSHIFGKWQSLDSHSGLPDNTLVVNHYACCSVVAPMQKYLK